MSASTVPASLGARRARSRWVPKLRVNWLGLLTAAALVGLWQVLVVTDVLDFTYLPTPAQIVSAAGELWSSGALPKALLHTTGVAVAGWLIAAVVGSVLGFAMGLLPAVGNWVVASCELLRAVPGVTLAPLAVILLGFSGKMELVLVVYVSLWPVFMSTYVGAKERDPHLADMARSMRLSWLGLVLKVVAPGAAADVFPSLRIALSMALNLTLLAEMIGNPAGIGSGLVNAQNALQPGQMFAYVIVTGLLGVLLNWLLMVLFKVCAPGLATNMERETR